MPQHARGFFARGTLAGTQEGCDGLLASGLEDQDRLEAGIACVGGEQGQLLAPMGEVDRIVDVEHDLSRHAGAQKASIIRNPMRASIRQFTAFSKRESVGCEASPISASGRLSQAIFSAGS